MNRIHLSGVFALVILSTLILAVGCVSPEAGAIGIAMAGVAGYGMKREAWFGSPATAALDTDAAAVEPMITFNERTIADLSRIVGWAFADAIATTLGYAGFDLIDSVDVVGLELYGSDQMIVGRNAPQAGIPLAPDRFVGNPDAPGFNLARLGKLPFASSDTISAELSITGTNIQGACGIAVPGVTSLQGQDFRPTKAPQYLGSGGAVQIAAAGSASVVMTADRAGWVPLSDLIISATADATVSTEVGAPMISSLGGLYLSGFQLPGKDQLIRGTGATTAPCGVYARNRKGNAIRHGGLFMDAGAAITLTVNNVGPDIVNVTAGLPFFATETKGKC